MLSLLLQKTRSVVKQLRKFHGGPIDQESELDDLVESFEDNPEGLRKALILEVRYRKFTLLNVKDSNPLFAHCSQVG